MSDHFHFGEYAEARHDHRGEYADERHDHDLDYAEKHHQHSDLERDIKALHGELDATYAAVRELRDDLRDALERLRQLEDRQPNSAPAPEDEPDHLALLLGRGLDVTFHADPADGVIADITDRKADVILSTGIGATAAAALCAAVTGMENEPVCPVCGCGHGDGEGGACLSCGCDCEPPGVGADACRCCGVSDAGWRV